MQQQQQTAPPVVVVVQSRQRYSYWHKYPHLLRGVTLNNGMNININVILIFGIFAITILFGGLAGFATGSYFISILCIIIGGGILIAVYKFIQKAKEDFDALPEDHPDRITYSVPDMLQRHEHLQLPSGTHVINTPSIESGARLLSQYSLPTNTLIIDGSRSVQTVVQQSATRNSQVAEQTSTPNLPIDETDNYTFGKPSTYNPEEDKPPSYEEACRSGAATSQ